jgi:hypothetical protein
VLGGQCHDAIVEASPLGAVLAMTLCAGGPLVLVGSRNSRLRFTTNALIVYVCITLDIERQKCAQCVGFQIARLESDVYALCRLRVLAPRSFNAITAGAAGTRRIVSYLDR